MISYTRYLAILGQSDAAVQQAAGAALQKLLEKIRQGQTPRTAIDQIMREFNADTLTGFREAFSAVLESSLGAKELKSWPVGGVKLSQRLYQNAQQVSATTRTIIEAHMKGLHSAQELRKALYEGYNFQQDPLNVIKPLPKYLQVEFDRFKAAQLKTPALRAAYLEAIRKAEAGAGMDAIEKKLRIAFYERNRYFANRIARTELHRAYTDQQARELMEQERIEYVQIRLSSKHPKTDICDYHAKVDLYGLGPGVYPKAEAPKPPFHPHCYCQTAPRIDLINPKPRFNPKAERAFLATLPAKEAAQVAGSFEKRRRILEDKESLEGIYNEGKDALYRWRRMGDGEVGQDVKMKADKIKALTASGAVAPESPVKPATPAEIEAFVADVLSNRSNNKGRLVLDVVSNAERQRIQVETGIDVGESSKILLPSTVIHATNEHPNLTPADWRQIADVLREFDGVFLSLDKGRNQELRLAFIKLAGTPEAYGCVVDVAKGKKRGGPRLNVATFYRDHINMVLSLVRQSAAKKDEVDRFVAQLSAQGKLPSDRLLRSTPPTH